MDNVLIVSSSQKGTQMLYELLTGPGFLNINTVESGALARRTLVDGSYDLIVINTPLCDEFGDELANRLAETSAAGVMLIVRSEILEEISDRVEDFGVFVIEKPISKSLFFHSLKMSIAAKKRLEFFKQKNDVLENKIQEIRLIDRAKCILIQYLNLTEPQAHRYIEKQAMNMRTTKCDISKQILKTYEN